MYKTILSIMFFSLTGCAGYNASLERNDKPESGVSYIYGRFTIDSEKHVLALDGYATMGFVLECDEHNKVTVKFHIKPDIQLIPLPENSTCAFKEIVYTNGDGMVKSREPIPPEMQHPRHYEGNKAYYLGDYDAAARYSEIGSTLVTTWQITLISDNYNDTTSLMKNNFHDFAKLPTEKNILLLK